MLSKKSYVGEGKEVEETEASEKEKKGSRTPIVAMKPSLYSPVKGGSKNL